MGTFTEEKVIGVKWTCCETSDPPYERVFTGKMTAEQIQQVYEDYIGIDFTKTYETYVLFHFCYTVGRYSQYFSTWKYVDSDVFLHFLCSREIQL